MKHTLVTFLCSSLLLVSIMSRLAQPARAASLDVSVSPPVTYAKLKPGDKTAIQIMVQNQSPVEITVTPTLHSFVADTQTGVPLIDFERQANFPYLDPNSNNSDLGKPFTLSPQQKQVVQLPISVPTSVNEQEFHLSVMMAVSPVATGELSGPGAEVTGMVASNVVITIGQGSINRGQLQIKQIISPAFVDSLQKWQFSILAENVGPHAVAASGSATITDWRGQTVAEYTFYPDVILSQSSRPLRTSLTGHLADPSTLEDITPDFTYDPVWWIGPYHLTIKLWEATNTNPTPVVINHYVVALPLSLILVTSLILGCLIFWRLVIKTKNSSTKEVL